jgi:DNA-binding response OmpR family regulator
VLLVDDDVDTVEMYAVGLSHAGYRPLTATDAESATRLTKSAHPNAVVTDLQLPGTSGWTFIRDLKNDPATRKIPIILLTGRVDVSMNANARKAGCAAVVTKPCLPEELAKVLDRVLRNRSTVA